MSLVSTYVRATDGKLYKNPVLSGQGWFICFDDDDPVELVIKKKSNIKPQDIFKQIGMKVVNLSKMGEGALRYFGDVNDEPEKAENYFFEIRNRINPKFITAHDGVVERENLWQGVIYDPKE